MRNVTLKAQQSLVYTNALAEVQAVFLPPPSSDLLLGSDPKYNITSFPIRRLVTLAFVDGFVTFGHAGFDIQSVVTSMIRDLVSATVRAGAGDDLALAVTFIALNLGLGKHAREDLGSLKLDALSVATWASLDITV